MDTDVDVREVDLVIEPAGSFQHRGCIACTGPAVRQVTAILDRKRLPVSVAFCGHTKCQEYAEKEARRIASDPEIQAKAV